MKKRKIIKEHDFTGWIDDYKKENGEIVLALSFTNENREGAKENTIDCWLIEEALNRLKHKFGEKPKIIRILIQEYEN